MDGNMKKMKLTQLKLVERSRSQIAEHVTNKVSEVTVAVSKRVSEIQSQSECYESKAKEKKNETEEERGTVWHVKQRTKANYDRMKVSSKSNYIFV